MGCHCPLCTLSLGFPKPSKNVPKALAVRTLLRKGDFGSRQGRWWGGGVSRNSRRPWPSTQGSDRKRGRHLSSPGPGYPKAPWQLCSERSFIELRLGGYEGCSETRGGPGGWCWWPPGLRSAPHQFLAALHKAASPAAPGLGLWGAWAPPTAGQGGVAEG